MTNVAPTVTAPRDLGEAMQMQRIFVTVAIAEKWLEKDFGNRTIQDSNIEYFASMLRTLGHLANTHQGIAFSPTGKLLDGQHRLHAIVRTGIGAWQWVCFNHPESDASYIDCGRPRTLADRVHIECGRDVSLLECATARVMAFGPVLSGAKKFRDAKHATEFMASHADAIAFAQASFARRSRGIVSSIEQAIIARAFYSQPHNDLRRFCEVLTTGHGDDESKIVISLRDFLMGGRDERVRKGSGALMRYGKCERALEAFLCGEPLSKLVTAKKELFPLPEEVAGKRVTPSAITPTPPAAQAQRPAKPKRASGIFDVLRGKWVDA